MWQRLKQSSLVVPVSSVLVLVLGSGSDPPFQSPGSGSTPRLKQVQSAPLDQQGNTPTASSELQPGPEPPSPGSRSHSPRRAQAPAPGLTLLCGRPHIAPSRPHVSVIPAASCILFGLILRLQPPLCLLRFRQ
uniref:Uncharacterized protein n=1 Tax=Knipowitschia caucasica TaxID=637954 RepID=A0AAV2L9V3_KNICA